MGQGGKVEIDVTVARNVRTASDGAGERDSYQGREACAHGYEVA